MSPLDSFIKRFSSRLKLDNRLVVEKKNRYYLVNETLRPYVRRDFFYAGAYVGKLKNKVFFPSFILLAMIADGEANKVMVNEKAAWLFICKRDIFKQGILKLRGSGRKGNHTLVLNGNSECLGFGKIVYDFDEVKDENKVVVDNISDIGDFLRREKHQKM